MVIALIWNLYTWMYLKRNEQNKTHVWRKETKKKKRKDKNEVKTKVSFFSTNDWIYKGRIYSRNILVFLHLVMHNSVSYFWERLFKDIYF